MHKKNDKYISYINFIFISFSVSNKIEKRLPVKQSTIIMIVYKCTQNMMIFSMHIIIMYTLDSLILWFWWFVSKGDNIKSQMWNFYPISQLTKK